MAEIDYSKTSTEMSNWFGVDSPIFIATILAVYLLAVLKIIPNYMKDRKPYDLKAFMVIYNVFQVLTCVYTLSSISNVTSTKVFHFWKCSLFEPNTREEYLYNRITYFIFWLKIVELSETIVFSLRKKQNQISLLHLFHHCSTITLVYILVKHYSGGSALYPLFLNTTVHVVMYSYYLAAAVCSKDIVDSLLPIKKSITTIQMIQFVLILTQTIVMWHNCTIPHIIVAYYFTVISVMFYGFYDFYQKSYKPPQVGNKNI